MIKNTNKIVGLFNLRSLGINNIVKRYKYNKSVMEHYENPKNVGSLDKKSNNVGIGLVGAPACGDVMKLDLKLDIDERIEDVKFKTYGCGSAIASSSLFVDMLIGKTIEEAKEIKDKDIAEVLELPPIKLHCSVLAEDCIKKAIEHWEEKSEHRKHNQQ